TCALPIFSPLRILFFKPIRAIKKNRRKLPKEISESPIPMCINRRRLTIPLHGMEENIKQARSSRLHTKSLHMKKLLTKSPMFKRTQSLFMNQRTKNKNTFRPKDPLIYSPSTGAWLTTMKIWSSEEPAKQDRPSELGSGV